MLNFYFDLCNNDCFVNCCHYNYLWDYQQWWTCKKA